MTVAPDRPRTVWQLSLSLLLVLALGESTAVAFTDSASAELGPDSLLARRTPAPSLIRPIAEANLQKRLEGRPAYRRFIAAHDAWSVWFDAVSERPSEMMGPGIPLLPGRLSDIAPQELGLTSDVTPPAVLERVAKDFINNWNDLFQVDLSEWQIDPGQSGRSRSGRQSITLVRSIDGIRIREASIFLNVHQGLLSYVAMNLPEPVDLNTAPALSADMAVEIALGGIPADTIELVDVPKLEVLGTANGSGPLVGGRDKTTSAFRLVWTTQFRIPEHFGTWLAMVDARDGTLLVLEDRNHYQCALDPSLMQGRVQGGVRPAQASDNEVVRYFPFTRVVQGVNVTTDFNGWYAYTYGVTTSGLNGTYFNTNNVGGNQPAATSSAGGDINFGLGGVNQTWNGFSTPADRCSFYHLNVARQIGAKWSNRAWLNNNVGVTVNTNNTCNAFWNGTTLNFYRSGGGCGNTGEMRDVMQHEWGHGFDDNDGNGITDSALSEAFGDVIALFVDHDSCIGQSFQAGRNTGPYCLQIPTCGSTAICDGVRNIDEKRSTRGILSTANANAVCTTGACGVSICCGPMNRECHCEGEIFGQAIFHLAMNLLTGNDYDTGAPLGAGNPAYSNAAAWYILENLVFDAMTNPIRTYHPNVGGNPSAYVGFTLADDNDGNLNNGTPNGAYINSAFLHHGIQDTPVIGDSANCVPPANANVAVLQRSNPANGALQIQLSWPDVAGAAFYDVYRRDLVLPDDVWLPVRTNVPVGGNPIYDEPVQNAISVEYVVFSVNAAGCVSSGATRIVNVARPEIDVVAQTVTDPAPQGNGNGGLDPGEWVRVRFDLREVGALAGATAVEASLVTVAGTPAGVTVFDAGPVVYGNFAAGQTINGPTTFGLQIAANVACGTRIPLALLISSPDGCWMQAVALSVLLPCTPCTTCQAPSSCGDGVVQPNEGCDQGASNSDNGDCTSLCQPARCGDGFLHTTGTAPFEQCDTTTDSTTCDFDSGTGPQACTLVLCGDGYVNAAAGEQCDVAADSATCDFAGGSGPQACTTASCGDGYTNVAAGEDCDTTADSSTCDFAGGSGPEACSTALCGDGYTNVAAGEECETAMDSDTCDFANGSGPEACTAVVCGDGYINPVAGEECDTTVDSATCDFDGGTGIQACTLPSCGDGYINTVAGEECETTADSSTCDFDAGTGAQACTTVVCGDGYSNAAAGEMCDTTADSATCDFATGTGPEACTAVTCGDGYINTTAGEECETTADSATCDFAGGTGQHACTNALCGDDYLNTVANEVCDDGNLTDGDGCDATCQPEASCIVSNLSRVAALLAVKARLVDARFSWGVDAAATEYHINSVGLKTLIATAKRSPAGVGIGECESLAPVTTCDDANALTDPRRMIFYQALSSCGPDGATEGPL